MKNFIQGMAVLLFVLYILIPMAEVHGQFQQQSVQETANQDGNVQSVNICASGGAVDVTAATSTGTISGAFAVEVYNLAASTSTLNCGFTLNVTSASTNAWYGREIPAGVGIYFGLRQNIVSTATAGLRKLYCMTQNSSGCTRATITQVK